jgi:hypothetical protein
LWQNARKVILINPKYGVKKAVTRECVIDNVFDDRECQSLRHYLKAIRIHQWLKNEMV